MSSTTLPTRRATHSGSWYTSSSSTLSRQLTQWLSSVDPSAIPHPRDVSKVTQTSLTEQQPWQEDGLSIPIPGVRAVIAPHAGYSYSGPPAAWAYHLVPTTGIKRVFILGPSHHYYLSTCALSTCEAYETPLGDLPVDRRVVEELKNVKGAKWEIMSVRTEEEEHSIEMHAPYVRKVFEGQDISIVPILVGAINSSKEASFGSLLAPYLLDPENFFVISSDFCHWGSRFSYTYYRPSPTSAPSSLSSRIQPEQSKSIHQSIRELDDQGMQAISFPRSDSTPRGGKTAGEAFEQFSTYLSETRNTICGRHPIGVLLGALAELEKTNGVKSECRFTRYEQSSECESVKDSSVSYASAIIRFL